MSNSLSLLTGSASSLLDQVKGLFPAGSVTVTSTGRTTAQNAAVGGAPMSDHLTGNAIDFQVAGYTPQQVQAVIANSGVTYGKLIDETSKGDHVHISAGTAMENMVYSNGSYPTVSDASLKAVQLPTNNVDGSNPGSVANGVLGQIGNYLNHNPADDIQASTGWKKNPDGAAGDIKNYTGFDLTAFLTKYGIVIAGGAVILLGLWQLVKDPVNTVAGNVAGAAANLA